MSTLNLTVRGMTCNNCTTRLKRVLDTVDGIIATDIVLETGQLRVEHDDVGPDEIKAAITDAGFSVV